MNPINMKTKLTQALPLAAGLFALAPAANAQFTYNALDVLAVFRQTASPNLDLEVDLGQASIYYGLSQTAPGSTISINNYNLTQFNTAFPGGVSGVSWAVMGAVPNNFGTVAHPVRTVWLTDPRLDINTQTTPYRRAC